MMLADHGAEVVRIERAGWNPPIPPDKDILRRNREAILTLHLKDAIDVARVCELARTAAALNAAVPPSLTERAEVAPGVLPAAHTPTAPGRITPRSPDEPPAPAT